IAPGRNARIFARTVRAWAATSGAYFEMNASSCSSGDRSFKADPAPSCRPSRRARRQRNKARTPPRDTTSEATEVVAAVEGAGREPSKGLGAERALPESEIHRVVETLHPGDQGRPAPPARPSFRQDRKSTRLNSSHQIISYAVFCLKKKKTQFIAS